MSFFKKLFMPHSCRNRDPYACTEDERVSTPVNVDAPSPLLSLDTLVYFQEITMLFEGVVVDRLLNKNYPPGHVISLADVQEAFCAAADEVVIAIELDQAGDTGGPYFAQTQKEGDQEEAVEVKGEG